MPDLIDVITSAVSDAGLSEAGGTDASIDTNAVLPDATADPVVPAVVDGQPAAGADGVVVPPTKAAEVDEIAKLLEAEGIKAPAEGQRDNRMPYSRVKKVVENAQKKLTDVHTAALAERDTKLSRAEEELGNFRRADQLATSDPDRYMEMLVAVNPAFKKFTGVTREPAVDTKPAATVAATVEALGPRPAPDHKFEDGSMGYTPDQHTKLLDWVAATAEARAFARAEDAFTTRFGPIEKEWKSNQVIQEKIPVIRGQIAAVKEVWGELFTKHEQDILKVMHDNEAAWTLSKGTVPLLSLDAAAAKVLVPKSRADRDTMRADLLKEINGARPAAAARSGPGAVTVGKDDPNEPRTTEQIIRESITAAGLLK